MVSPPWDENYLDVERHQFEEAFTGNTDDEELLQRYAMDVLPNIAYFPELDLHEPGNRKLKSNFIKKQ